MSILEKKEQLFAELKQLQTPKCDENNPRLAELEKEIASLFPLLLGNYTLCDLTQADLIFGKKYCGFLHNVYFDKFVGVDSDFKWLYANQDKSETAVFWEISLDSASQLVLKATIGGAICYFNWRSSTGACKLYDSYDGMAIEWNQTTSGVFQFRSTYWEQYIGTWSSSDNELYVRKNNENHNFQFRYIDEPKLTDKDKIILNCYLTHNNN